MWYGPVRLGSFQEGYWNVMGRNRRTPDWTPRRRKAHKNDRLSAHIKILATRSRFVQHNHARFTVIAIKCNLTSWERMCKSVTYESREGACARWGSP